MSTIAKLRKNSLMGHKDFFGKFSDFLRCEMICKEVSVKLVPFHQTDMILISKIPENFTSRNSRTAHTFMIKDNFWGRNRAGKQKQ